MNAGLIMSRLLVRLVSPLAVVVLQLLVVVLGDNIPRSFPCLAHDFQAVRHEFQG